MHVTKVERDQFAAQKRALEMATCSTAAAVATGGSKKQKTLFECALWVRAILEQLQLRAQRQPQLLDH